jgi:RimJ/RimL family protein N-acetyltransferase
MINSIKKYISIQNKKYTYFLFNINDLIILLKEKKELVKSFEDIMKLHRNNPNFKIEQLIQENIYFYPEIVNYFIIYKNNEIISCARLIYKNNSKQAYLGMVHTNHKYRKKNICTRTIDKLISITKNNFNKYELEVEEDNIAAIKCYQKNGFKYVKTKIYNNIKVNIMILNI